MQALEAELESRCPDPGDRFTGDDIGKETGVSRVAAEGECSTLHEPAARGPRDRCLQRHPELGDSCRTRRPGPVAPTQEKGLACS